jgi:hypothetical protein
MDEKKINGYPVYTEEETDITNVVSTGELTGLHPRLPVNNGEVEAYSWLYDGAPQPMNVLNGKKRGQSDTPKDNMPKIILPL